MKELLGRLVAVPADEKKDCACEGTDDHPVRHLTGSRCSLELVGKDGEDGRKNGERREQTTEAWTDYTCRTCQPQDKTSRNHHTSWLDCWGDGALLPHLVALRLLLW